MKKKRILAFAAMAIMLSSCSKGDGSIATPSSVCTCTVRWSGTGGSSSKDTTITFPSVTTTSSCDSVNKKMQGKYGYANSANNYTGASCDIQ